MLYILSILALLASCAACALSMALTFRVQKTIGAAPDISAILSSPAAPVNPGTRIADHSDLADVNGSPFSLPTDSTEPWVLTFHSLECGGCREQLPAYRKFLAEQRIPEERAVTIAMGEPSELDWLKDGLDGAGRVVHVAEDSRIVLDLQIATWPVYLVVGRDATVIHATRSATRLSTFQLSELADTSVPGAV
ncbi:TlpA family protein disulfide reductase [Streptomyces sp. NPDC059569]|uniref:TlpA family protein disulfide reductase n=1 Tax=unclassified Streptomyces TaxID=2593676 RepID=UPI003681E570